MTVPGMVPPMHLNPGTLTSSQDRRYSSAHAMDLLSVALKPAGLGFRNEFLSFSLGRPPQFDLFV